MDIRFLAPDLRALDEASVEVAVASFWQDERPMRGFAGLLDWRLWGVSAPCSRRASCAASRARCCWCRASRTCRSRRCCSWVWARAPPSTRPRSATAPRAWRARVQGLRVRRAVVELPGRGTQAIEAERAMILALECLGPKPEHDAWWLVEDAPAQKIRAARADEPAGGEHLGRVTRRCCHPEASGRRTPRVQGIASRVGCLGPWPQDHSKGYTGGCSTSTRPARPRRRRPRRP